MYLFDSPIIYWTYKNSSSVNVMGNKLQGSGPIKKSAAFKPICLVIDRKSRWF